MKVVTIPNMITGVNCFQKLIPDVDIANSSLSCESLLKTNPVEINIDMGMLVNNRIGSDVIKKLRTITNGILLIIIN